MLSKLEKIGLMSILDRKLQQGENHKRRHLENSQMADQSEGYRVDQYQNYRYYVGMAQGLQIALDEIKDIPTQ